MFRLRIVCIIATFAAIISAAEAAQTRYVSTTLERIAKNLAKANNDILAQELRINHRADSAVTHIGFRFFDDGLMNSLGCDSALALFVERYLLDVALPQPENRTLSKRLLEDDVKTDGTLPIAKMYKTFADKTNPVNISFPAKRVRFSSGEHFIDFPRDIHLISGMSHDEAETAFIDDLEIIISGTTDVDLRTKDDKKNFLESIFVDELTTWRYRDATGKIIFSPDSPAESIINLVTGTDIILNDGISTTVSVSTYIPSPKMTMPLDRLIGLLIGKGLKIYAGITEIDSEKARCLVVAANSNQGFAHTLHFEIPISILYNCEPAEIKVKIYPNLPLSKIQNLYFDKQ